MVSGTVHRGPSRYMRLLTALSGTDKTLSHRLRKRAKRLVISDSECSEEERERVECPLDTASDAAPGILERDNGGNEVPPCRHGRAWRGGMTHDHAQDTISLISESATLITEGGADLSGLDDGTGTELRDSHDHTGSEPAGADHGSVTEVDIASVDDSSASSKLKADEDAAERDDDEQPKVDAYFWNDTVPVFATADTLCHIIDTIIRAAAAFEPPFAAKMGLNNIRLRPNGRFEDLEGNDATRDTCIEELTTLIQMLANVTQVFQQRQWRNGTAFSFIKGPYKKLKAFANKTKDPRFVGRKKAIIAACDKILRLEDEGWLVAPTLQSFKSRMFSHLGRNVVETVWDAYTHGIVVPGKNTKVRLLVLASVAVLP
jgi:hypothetical protein